MRGVHPDHSKRATCAGLRVCESGETVTAPPAKLVPNLTGEASRREGITRPFSPNRGQPVSTTRLPPFVIILICLANKNKQRTYRTQTSVDELTWLLPSLSWCGLWGCFDQDETQPRPNSCTLSLKFGGEKRFNQIVA